MVRMSGSSGLATVSRGEPAAGPRSRPKAWLVSPYALPLHTLRLWVRCLLPMSIWFSVGELLRFVLTVAGSEFSHGPGREWRLAGVMFLFIVMVMATMVVTIGMLHSVRGALMEIRARRAEGSDEREPFLGGIGRAIVPFAAVYLAWGWFVDDAREFADADMERYAEQYDRYQAALIMNALDGGGNTPPPEPPDAGTNLVMDVRIALIFTVVAFVLRYLVMLLYERRGGGTVLSFALAFCEITFTFYSLAVIVESSSAGKSWLAQRTVAQWWNDAWAQLEQAVPGWETFWSLLGEIRPHVMDVVVPTLIWLTLAILVFGPYSEDVRDVIKGTRLERVGSFVEERTHELTRRSAGHLTVRLGLDKWPPLLNALRFVVRGGAPLFAMACLCHVALSVGAGYVERGAYYLIGTAHRQLEWEVYQIPVRFGVDLLFMTLLLCLLAATFDLSATRQRLNRSTSEPDALE
ncbi:hypothetical protein FHX40_3942 [Thermopolyspora flexuosa]|jgi:hypothetical protein|uniref:Uncharacterized protein n=2 Tax=Thermopolyspora flexuosa TaxID=103836 RepID=A0A543J2Y1_9ACTN|nr:hypothetical protein FHX40_3942 [Thermopolyspora flexuosa]